MKASEQLIVPYELIVKTLGFPGQMLSGSKLSYNRAFPEHTVYFNACVFDDFKRQIWHGDLDLTLLGDKLQELANAIGTIHVTPEHPYRFYGFDEGKVRDYDNRIVTFEPQEAVK